MRLSNRTGLTTGLTTVLNEQTVRSTRLSNHVCQTGCTNRFDNRLNEWCVSACSWYWSKCSDTSSTLRYTRLRPRPTCAACTATSTRSTYRRRRLLVKTTAMRRPPTTTMLAIVLVLSLSAATPRNQEGPVHLYFWAAYRSTKGN